MRSPCIASIGERSPVAHAMRAWSVTPPVPMSGVCFRSKVWPNDGSLPAQVIAWPRRRSCRPRRRGRAALGGRRNRCHPGGGQLHLSSGVLTLPRDDPMAIAAGVVNRLADGRGGRRTGRTSVAHDAGKQRPDAARICCLSTGVPHVQSHGTDSRGAVRAGGKRSNTSESASGAWPRRQGTQ